MPLESSESNGMGCSATKQQTHQDEPGFIFTSGRGAASCGLSHAPEPQEPGKDLFGNKLSPPWSQERPKAPGVFWLHGSKLGMLVIVEVLHRRRYRKPKYLSGPSIEKELQVLRPGQTTTRYLNDKYFDNAWWLEIGKPTKFPT